LTAKGQSRTGWGDFSCGCVMKSLPSGGDYASSNAGFLAALLLGERGTAGIADR
jgi:hypothetical protein